MTDPAVERWMRSLLASTSETSIVILSVEGVILAWLGAAPLLFGYSAEEAVGMPFSRLFTPQDIALLQAAEGMTSMVPGRGQQLKVTLPDVPIVIEADAQRLNQILVNLLSNASKFTPARGIVQLSATVEDDMAAIRVEDDGEGIAPAVLPRIFELFTRGDSARNVQGLGVGLSVVRPTEEGHG